MPKIDRPVVIVGAGPAGTSLAIRLRRLGLSVVLIERYKFPRQKLCGEFISPECLRHFAELGVLDEMLAAGGDRVYETVFYETGGASVSVPSRWFDESGFALSLSRARMDQILLKAAEDCGAVVMQGTTATQIRQEHGSILGLTVRDSAGTITDIEASIVVDATGRARVVSRMAEKSNARKEPRPRFVGLKAHITGAGSPRGVCEIYGFRGGYAGLSFVEDGRSNLCFLAKASLLSGTNDADAVLDGLRDQNRRAAETLVDIRKAHDWISVSVPSFGMAQPPGVKGLYTIGDAAAFVDPFTGSGMLMAMESAECLAHCVDEFGVENAALRPAYDRAHRERFASRLKISGLIRRVAYEPALSWAMVRLLSMSRKMRSRVARRTRSTRAADGL
jgi:flavin-dependent dehydrogenase